MRGRWSPAHVVEGWKYLCLERGDVKVGGARVDKYQVHPRSMEREIMPSAPSFSFCYCMRWTEESRRDAEELPVPISIP